MDLAPLVKLAEKAVTADPQPEDVRRLAALLVRKGDLGPAKARLEELRKRPAADRDARDDLLLALALAQDGKAEEARALLKAEPGNDPWYAGPEARLWKREVEERLKK